MKQVQPTPTPPPKKKLKNGTPGFVLDPHNLADRQDIQRVRVRNMFMHFIHLFVSTVCLFPCLRVTNPCSKPSVQYTAWPGSEEFPLGDSQINLVGSNRLVQYSLQYPINQEIGASPSHHIRAMGTTATGAPLAIRSEKRQKIETSAVRSILLMGKSCQISILAG